MAHTWFLLLFIKGVRNFHIYFSFKFCKRLCVSVLEVFITLGIKILTLSKRRPSWYRNQSIVLINGPVSIRSRFRHEKVNISPKIIHVKMACTCFFNQGWCFFAKLKPCLSWLRFIKKQDSSAFFSGKISRGIIYANNSERKFQKIIYFKVIGPVTP